MAQQKKTSLYKHEELIAENRTVGSASYHGLFVSHDDDFADFSLQGQHFRSDFFGVMLVLEGQVDIAVNLQHYTLRKNNLVISPPNSIKQLGTASGRARAMLVSFTTKFLTEAGLPKHSHDLLNYFTSQGNPVWNLDVADAVVLQKMIRDLVSRCQTATSRAFGKEQLHHTFFVFMYEMAALSQKYAPHVLTNISRKEELVIRFAELVTLHFRDHRTVQHYAELLHITPKYLTETVKEISGKNAGEIIDDFVILECKLLLEDPGLSIAQVASKLNFSDQSFFGKFFKRHTGSTPRQYRDDLYR